MLALQEVTKLQPLLPVTKKMVPRHLWSGRTIYFCQILSLPVKFCPPKVYTTCILIPLPIPSPIPLPLPSSINLGKPLLTVKTIFGGTVFVRLSQ